MELPASLAEASARQRPPPVCSSGCCVVLSLRPQEISRARIDVAGRRESEPLGVRRQRAQSVAFSPDGSTYLVGTAKGSVILWDLDD